MLDTTVKTILRSNVQYIDILGNRWIDFKGFIHDNIDSTKIDAPPLANNDIILGVAGDRYIDAHLRLQIIKRKDEKLIDIGFTNVLEYNGNIRMLSS